MKLFLTGASGFIGTSFVNHALASSAGIAICNVDLTPPKLDQHRQYWIQGDVLDRAWLSNVVVAFQPSHVVHFAARTDMDGKTIGDYRVNFDGTISLIEALLDSKSVQRAIFVSSQYVAGPGPLASVVWDYRPHTIYGTSKCLMEEAVRAADLPFIWTLVRPTNIWGPLHPRYANEIWLVLKRGCYFHPGGNGVFRAYGYVGNVADQIWKLLHSSPAMVDKRPFYLGDPVEDILKWTTAFSRALTRRTPVVVPRFFLRALALVGDVIRYVGLPFPLFTSRFRSMTQDYFVDMEPTYRVVGAPPISLEQGVAETVEWLESLGKPWT